MTMQKDSRRINGIKYYLTGSAKPISKLVATKRAQGIRRSKFKAVVIKCKGGYRVFATRTR